MHFFFFTFRTKDQDSGKAASKREKKEKKEGKRLKEAEENEVDDGWEEVKRGIPRSSVSTHWLIPTP